MCNVYICFNIKFTNYIQTRMAPVSQATDIILKNLCSPANYAVPLEKCIGHVLGEPVFADRDFPPFDRVSMDGIAIAFDAFKEGKNSFPIEGTQPAGVPQQSLTNPENCFEVMTGAILPKGTDTVIRYEDLKIGEGHATILIEDIVLGQNVHRRGTDVLKDGKVLDSSGLLSAAEVAVLASVGKSSVVCKQFPSIAIISTGDELVSVDKIPEAHQIRSSNSLAIQASLRAMNIAATTFHIQDDQKIVEQELLKLFKDFEVLIISGGVSKGKFDFIPGALENLGIEKKFHGVKQRPGKPFWFGVGNGKTVFALPGNPVSTYMCFYRYVKPWILRSMGVSQLPMTAQLASDFVFAPPLTYFLQVQVTIQNGKLMAIPDAGKGSGDFANLSNVTGFLELPEDRSDFSAGEVFPYFPFRAF